jgi:hypothetical protein
MLGVFKKKKVYSDLVLGEFVRSYHNNWDCNIDLSNDYSNITLSIEGNEDGPSQLFVDAAVKLKKDFQVKLPDIEECIKKEYQLYYQELEKEGWHDNMPSPSDIDIKNLFSIINVSIGKVIFLTYCFSDGFDDSLFVVQINGDVITSGYVGD